MMMRVLLLALIVTCLSSPLLAATVTVVHVIDSAETVVAADLDQDGWDDLAYTTWLAAELSGQLWVAWNNHNNTYTTQLIDANLPWARDVKVLHETDRIYPSLTVSAYRAGHYLFGRSGRRSFLKRAITEPGYGSITHAVGIFDQYSRLEDLVTAQDGNPGSLTLWQNMDSGVFAARVTVPINEPSYVEMADIDGNTLHDVIVAHKTGVSYYLFSEGPWALSAPVSVIATANPVVFVKVVDLNRDGVRDFLAGGTFEGLFWVDGKHLGVRRTIDALLDSAMLADVSDLNADGRLDIAAVSLGQSMAIAVYWQQPDGSWLRQTLAQGYGGRGVSIGDFLHNGKQQIGVSSFNGDRVEVWEVP